MSMRLGLRLNTRIAAPTQYALPFNSLAWDGEQVLCGGDGLYRIAGDQDQTAPIPSIVMLVTTDFGSYNYKRFRWIQVGYESAGDLLLSVQSNEDMQESYTLPALGTDSKQTGQRIPVHRTLVGRYFTLTITNPLGIHFTLDSITASLTILPQKPRMSA